MGGEIGGDGPGGGRDPRHRTRHVAPRRHGVTSVGEHAYSFGSTAHALSRQGTKLPIG